MPGRIRFGTRLQFLTAQTEVSGIWLAERRVRLTVYLSGMALDAAVCAVCLLLTVPAGPQPALSVVAMTALLMLSTQFLVFMRTDLYFVLQDVTGCRNLYGDSAAYAAHVCRRALLRRSADPLARLPRTEGRWVRAYTALLLAGTALCLCLAVAVTIPATLGLLAVPCARCSTRPAGSPRRTAWSRCWSSPGSTSSGPQRGGAGTARRRAVPPDC